MSIHDHRARINHKNDAAGFYVFDDLRFAVNPKRPYRDDFDYFVYDTLEQALEQFRHIPSDMTPALGMQRSERSKLDLVQRFEGTPVLIADYQRLSDWRTDENVINAVNDLCEALDIRWEMNSKLLGHSILIPLDTGTALADNYNDDKDLRPNVHPYYPNRAHPFSAINEVFVEGKGWVDFRSLFDYLMGIGGYAPSELPKITKFNVNYVDSAQREGEMDVSPMELQILRERYTIRSGDEIDSLAAIDALANDLDLFARTEDPYEYMNNVADPAQHLEQLKEQLIYGDVADIMAYLQNFYEDTCSVETIAAANRLVARVKSAEGLARYAERKPTLDNQIETAKRTADNQDKGKGPELSDPEHRGGFCYE